MDASIELTDEQVKQLLRDDEIIKKINDERPRRSQYHQRWSQWLNIESLGQISDEELKKVLRVL